MAEKLFTKEQELFIRKNVKGRTVKELTEMVNAAFGLDVTKQQIHSYKKNHNLKSGTKGEFKKGHVPANKGKRYPGSGSCTSFEKGHKPHNWVPLGTERINPEGYIDIKVAEGKKQYNWKAKHIILWEQHHGPVPDDSIIIFADGNKLNCVIENLMKITKKQHLIINRWIKRPDNRELTESAALLADLLSKIYKSKGKVKRK